MLSEADLCMHSGSLLPGGTTLTQEGQYLGRCDVPRNVDSVTKAPLLHISWLALTSPLPSSRPLN
jgi:hypothetical protein